MKERIRKEGGSEEEKEDGRKASRQKEIKNKKNKRKKERKCRKESVKWEWGRERGEEREIVWKLTGTAQPQPSLCLFGHTWPQSHIYVTSLIP